MSTPPTPRSQRPRAGHSGTPLAKRLGIKEGFRVFVAGAPAHYPDLLDPLPPSVHFTSRPVVRRELR